MTHDDQEMDLDYDHDEIRRAQYETSSNRVEEYTLQSLDSPVYAEYKAIETYDRAITCHLNWDNTNTYHIK